MHPGEAGQRLTRASGSVAAETWHADLQPCSDRDFHPVAHAIPFGVLMGLAISHPMLVCYTLELFECLNKVP